MWIYFQKTGAVHYSGDPVMAPRFIGYSGVKPYQNDPESQCFHDLGPIPRGLYKMTGVKQEPTKFSIILTPNIANDMCGRANFLIHGDSASHGGWASQGCIVLKLAERELMWNSGDTDLEVRRG